jgi:hypothetical protein
MISVKGSAGKDIKPNNFIVSSVCTVATKEVQREAYIMLLSVRKIYNEIPFVIICDEESIVYFQSKDLKNVTLVEKTLKTPESVIKRSDYHRPDAILWKMDVMEEAINLHDDSCFLDADIILLERLTGPHDCNLALSLNLAEVGNSAMSAVSDGMFNAGMIWSNSVEFPMWWRDNYLRQGIKSFYEQGLLNTAHTIFRTGYFDLTHNYGFWRGPLGAREVKSFHCHLDNKLDDKMLQFMKPKVEELRRTLFRRLKKDHKDLYEIVNKVINNEM